MSDHGLPILDELRADLAAAFLAHESMRHRVGRRRALIPAAGLVVAAVVALLALTTGVNNGRLAPAPAGAAQLLNRVAAVAAQAPTTVPGDDQFAYIHSEGSNLATYAGVDPTHKYAVTLESVDRRSWMSIDRPGRFEQRVLGSKPLTPADARRAQDPDADVGVSEPIGPIHNYYLGGDRLSRAQLLAYPTDPQTIYDRLLAEVGDEGHSPQQEVFVQIGDALRDLPAPAALRAGLYGALALVPGIELVGAVHDSAGRPGTAVALTSVGTRYELIVDARTSELLAMHDVLVDPHRAGIHAPPYTVVGDVVYLERSVTDDVPNP